MFKKPFNKKVGETRQCKVCSEEFHTFKPIWKCSACTNEHIRQYNKANYQPGKLNSGPLRGKDVKKPYPFSTKTTEASRRFNRIKRELNQCWTKEERRAHYDKQLREIKENGIWEWIFDRRDDNSIRSGNIKAKTKIENEYPDTRNHYE